MGSGFGIRSQFGFRVWVSGSELRVIGWVVIGVEVEEVEGEEDAVNEQLIGGDKVGLRQRRVSELPELEFRRVCRVGADSSSTGGWCERVRDMRSGIFHFFFFLERESERRWVWGKRESMREVSLG